MTTPYTNGAAPTGEGPPPPVDSSGPDMAARQQAIQAYIEQLVETKVQAVLQAKGITGGVPVPGGVPVSQGPSNSVGVVVAQVVAALPAIAAAVTTTITAIMQAKVAANPLGHLEIIAQTNPRLLALYAPNPLGDQFMNIYAGAFLQGMRVAATGKAAAATPLAPGAPVAPGLPAPNPSSPPNTSANPSASTPAPGGLVTPPGSAGNPAPAVMGQMTDEQLGLLLSSIREEYQQRHGAVARVG